MAGITVFGHKFSKGEAVAIGAGGLVVIYFVWKQHEASAAASSSTSAIDPLTGLPTSEDNTVDPDTGMTYLAEAQQYGSVSAAEAAVAGESSLDYSGAYDTGTGSIGTTGTVYSTTSGTETGTNYANNAQWSQAVQAGLTDIGYTSTDVSAALGLYLGGAPLTTLSDGASALSIVQAALAEYGPPPVGSYQIVMPPATTSTTSGNTGTGTSTGEGSTTTTGTTTTGTTTTSSGGGTTTPAAAQASTSGGHVVSVNNNDAVISWTGHNAVKYKVVINGPGFPNKTTTQTGTTASFSGLQAGHDYVVTLTPYNSAGQAGVVGNINLVTTS